jgi:hypothetical protein
MLVSCLVSTSTLKGSVICSSHTSVDLYQTARRYVPKDRTLHTRPENLKSIVEVGFIMVKNVSNYRLIRDCI